MVRLRKPLSRVRKLLAVRDFGLVLSLVGAVFLVASRRGGDLW